VVVPPRDIDKHVEEELYRLVDSGWVPNTDLEVDLTKVTFIDTTGLHWLLWVHERVESAERLLCVVIPEDGIVASLLEATGCDQLFFIHRVESRSIR
jgi:anti-anti-sigma factor